MPTHYAASEMLILLVALWTAQPLWRHKIFYGALGIVLFGTAAAFGAVRFSFAGPAILLALFLPSTRVTLFLIWLLGFVVLCASRTPQIAIRGPVKAALAGVMLVNLLVLRQASWLTPAESWHAFHFVVACWLLAVYTLLVAQRAQV